MKTKVLSLLVMLLACSLSALIFVPEIPVDQKVLYKVQVSCNRLQRYLDKKFNTPYLNNQKAYKKTYLAYYNLWLLSQEPLLQQYNNIILGEANTSKGNKNFMIGNNNKVKGEYNFVFSNEFQSTAEINESLVLDNWLIELGKLNLIPKDAHLAISDWMKNPQ